VDTTPQMVASRVCRRKSLRGEREHHIAAAERHCGDVTITRERTYMHDDLLKRLAQRPSFNFGGGNAMAMGDERREAMGFADESGETGYA